MKKPNKIIEERENKVSVKYPKIRKLLKDLWKGAYLSGKDNSEGDTADYSSYYELIEKELEKALATQRKKIVEFLSHDMAFKNEKQRKTAVKMYLKQFEEV